MTAMALLLAVQMSVTPANPRVGDRVSLELLDSGAIGTVLPTECAEIVEQTSHAIVVRSFAVGECGVQFTLEGNPRVAHEAAFTVVSVLTDEDPSPSPYRPPIEVPLDRRAWWSIGISAAAALLTWTLVFLRRTAAAPAVAPVPSLPPFDELMASVASVGDRSGPEEQILVADALRRYLARTDRRLTTDRTTGEILRWLHRKRDARLETVGQILMAGDRAKFAPAGQTTSLPALHHALDGFIRLESQRRERLAG